MTGTFKCHKPNCPLCQHVVETNIITSKNTGESYRIPDYITCDSSNVNYTIECLKCGMQYVGSTGRKVRLRGSEHLYDVSTGKYSAVSQHFNQQDHSIFDMAIIFIQRALRKKDRRLLQEAELVNLLGTITPKGMNKIMPLLRHTLTTKELAHRSNALPMKMKPKMTWLQTVKKDNDTENDNEPPNSTPPRRYFHQGRSAEFVTVNGEMYSSTSMDTPDHVENTPPTKTNHDEMEKASKYNNVFYMGGIMQTVDQKRQKKTEP